MSKREARTIHALVTAAAVARDASMWGIATLIEKKIAALLQ